LHANSTTGEKRAVFYRKKALSDAKSYQNLIFFLLSVIYLKAIQQPLHHFSNFYGIFKAIEPADFKGYPHVISKLISTLLNV